MSLEEEFVKGEWFWLIVKYPNSELAYKCIWEDEHHSKHYHTANFWITFDSPQVRVLMSTTHFKAKHMKYRGSRATLTTDIKEFVIALRNPWHNFNGAMMSLIEYLTDA